MSGLVLVVDDEPLVRWSLGERLREAGFEVREAGTGQQAREHFAGDSGRCRVVLLDLKLPDADGLVLLDELRRLHPAWKVIILSAHITPEVALAALDRGAMHVGSKPFDLNEVVTLVQRGFEPATP